MKTIEEELLELGIKNITITGFYDTCNLENVLVYNFKIENKFYTIEIRNKDNAFNIFEMSEKGKKLIYTSNEKADMILFIEALQSANNNQIIEIKFTPEEASVIRKALTMYTQVLNTLAYQDNNTKGNREEIDLSDKLIKKLREIGA